MKEYPRAKGLKKAKRMMDATLDAFAGKDPTKKASGWYDEPTRHSLASRGLKTSMAKMNVDDRENFREALRAELKAINMYERVAEETSDADVARIFKHIADEEKHHLAEFGVGLRMLDKEQMDADDKGVEEILKEIEDSDTLEEKVSRANGKIDENLKEVKKDGK